MTVYSPSKTADFIRCPIFARLRKTVEPIADWTPNMLLGNAVTGALTQHYRALRDGTPFTQDAAEEYAMAVLAEGFQENETWTHEGLQRMLSRVLEAALDEPVITPGSTILLVDESTGGGRPDLVLRQRNGRLSVTDTKFTLKLEQQYVGKTLSQYETDDQFWQYGWEAEQMFGGSVEWLRVHLLAGTPKAKSLLHPWKVTPERLAFWLTGAEQAWRDLEAQEKGERPETPRWQSCNGTRFGRCMFLAWCHEPETRALFFRELPPRIKSSLE